MSFFALNDNNNKDAVVIITIHCLRNRFFTAMCIAQVMQTLGPVLKRIEVRPRILRQPTLKEFFKPLPMTNEDAVAKIRSKRIERAIQQVKSTHNVIKTLTHTDTNIANPASLRDKSAVKKAKSKPRKQRTKKQPAATR